MLAKSSFRIVKKLKGSGSDEMINIFLALVNVLAYKNDFTDETKNLLDDYLGDSIRHEGIDGKSLGVIKTMCDYGDYFCKLFLYFYLSCGLKISRLSNKQNLVSYISPFLNYS
jgi:hypothetical protein